MNRWIWLHTDSGFIYACVLWYRSSLGRLYHSLIRDSLGNSSVSIWWGRELSSTSFTTSLTPAWWDSQYMSSTYIYMYNTCVLTVVTSYGIYSQSSLHVCICRPSSTVEIYRDFWWPQSILSSLSGAHLVSSGSRHGQIYHQLPGWLTVLVRVHVHTLQTPNIPHTLGAVHF